MYSVTARIEHVKQPQGGYIKPSQFKVYAINDEQVLNEKENIPAILIGLVVDYLTRYAMGVKVSEAFRISCIGAERAQRYGQKDALEKANRLLEGINGLEERSIINACKLVTYDVWLRNPRGAMRGTKGADDIYPDKNTIENIKILIRRSLHFWECYGPIIKDGFTFGPNGYTDMVSSGDGDYLTEDTLWDFKVSKKKPTSKHTLQLLMYWIMGQHSGQKIFENIQKMGIFNPRLNTVYLLNVKEVSQEIIHEVEQDVICYSSDN